MYVHYRMLLSLGDLGQKGQRGIHFPGTPSGYGVLGSDLCSKPKVPRVRGPETRQWPHDPSHTDVEMAFTCSIGHSGAQALPDSEGGNTGPCKKSQGQV